MKFVHLLINVAYPILQLYWKLCKPSTYGVRILIHDTDDVLLIQQTYGNKNLLLIPGGGYKPAKETPREAIVREVQEELGTQVHNVQEIGMYKTDAEGKHDTVTIFSGTVDTSKIHTQRLEIANSMWQHFTTALQNKDISIVAQKAIHLHYNQIEKSCKHISNS